MYPSLVAKLLEILSKQLHLLCYTTIIYVLVHKIKVVLEGSGRSAHLVVISATYYKNTASGYPNHTMVVLLNAPKDMHPKPHLLCWSRSNSSSRLHRASLTLAHVPYRACQWGTFILTCPVAAEPASFSLGDVRQGAENVEIPYRRPVDRRLDVVTCYSPLFYAERWQPLVTALEIYRHFGASLQVFYVQSMLNSIVQFLRAYERRELVRMEPWTGLNLDKMTVGELGYEPNTEIEWRNQPAAHTDCLLLFKEAAEFIIIVDIDDFLFPRRGSTYLEEFRAFASDYPTAAAFVYFRIEASYVSALAPKYFSLSSLLDSTRIKKLSSDFIRESGGKSVVRPSRVQTSWIHHPAIIDEPYNLRQLAEEDNVMIHMRTWRKTFESPKYDWISVQFQAERANATRPALSSTVFYERQIADFLSPSNSTALGDDFSSFVGEYAQREYDVLPSKIRYYPHIQQCYGVTFYGLKEASETCTTGPWKCQVPRLKNTKCAVAQRRFRRNFVRNGLFIHLSKLPAKFVVENDGCTL